ncbi:hypothetical protein [Tsuneonella amylolytica]|uniref:hypothetical protein n=1 Tax=Tsuneonella amylolytica TaxID=2338327 RepID=UPI000EA9C444|nr:hypothetical protein [Tsuneonella amylolytica]
MADDYSETTDWPGTAWAFVVWALHFSILWGSSSIFPGDDAARLVALVATLGALAALALLWRWRSRKGAGRIFASSVGIAAVAVIFGSIPAAVG